MLEERRQDFFQIIFPQQILQKTVHCNPIQRSTLENEYMEEEENIYMITLNNKKYDICRSDIILSFDKNSFFMQLCGIYAILKFW